jgi:uncharacterized protein YbjT (DUF2867 family)
MKIAITTPTGKVGSKVTQLLLDRGGHELTLIARDPAKVAQFTARGAKAISANLEDAAQLTAAFKGAEVAFLVSPPKMDAPDFQAFQNKVGDNFVAALRANGIKRVVFLSSYGAQHKDGTGPIAGLHDIEKKLNAAMKESGGSVTHLRPAFFQENWFMYVPTIKEQGAAYGPIKPETRAPMIATSDIARVAADVIQDTTWSGVQVRELLGPRDYSFAEAAKIIGEAAGKPVNFVQVPADQARQAMAGRGLGKSITDKYLEMYSGMESGRVGSETGRSAQSTTPTRLEDFARQALAPAIRG